MSTFVPKKKRATEPTLLDQTQVTRDSAEQPHDLVVVGRIGIAYGIKGWAKIHPFSHSPDALLHAKQWWIAPYIPEQAVEQVQWQAVFPSQLKPHADAWVGVCAEWADRTQAERLKGWQIAIARADFPQTDENEFYWVDLLGAHVINQDQVVLGEVVGFLENAAHTVLTIRGLNSATEQKSVEYLIPFVSAFVGEVDLLATPKTIAVTWDVAATA